jgi:flagellar biosynthesis protein FliP
MDHITFFVTLVLSIAHTSKNYCQMAHLRLLTYNEINAAIEVAVGLRGLRLQQSVLLLRTSFRVLILVQGLLQSAHPICVVLSSTRCQPSSW